MGLSQKRESRERQLANLKKYKPGETGNPGGRPRNTPITDALRELLSDPKELSAFVRAAARNAKNGGGVYFKEIAERVEGKVPDQVDISGEVSLVERLTAARKRVKRDEDPK